MEEERRQRHAAQTALKAAEEAAAEEKRAGSSVSDAGKRAQGSPFDEPPPAVGKSQAVPSAQEQPSVQRQTLQEEVDALRLQLQQQLELHQADVLSAAELHGLELEEAQAQAQEAQEAQAQLHKQMEAAEAQVRVLRTQSRDAAAAAKQQRARADEAEAQRAQAVARAGQAEAAAADAQRSMLLTEGGQAATNESSGAVGTVPLSTPTKSSIGIGSDLSPIAPGTGPGGGSSLGGLGRRSRSQEANALLDSTPLYQRELAALTAVVARERRQLGALQEQHNDLLALLAQEEVELGVFRDALQQQGGVQAVAAAATTAQRVATERYGTYVDLSAGADW